MEAFESIKSAAAGGKAGATAENAKQKRIAIAAGFSTLKKEIQELSDCIETMDLPLQNAVAGWSTEFEQKLSSFFFDLDNTESQSRNENPMSLNMSQGQSLGILYPDAATAEDDLSAISNDAAGSAVLIPSTSDEDENDGQAREVNGIDLDCHEEPTSKSGSPVEAESASCTTPCLAAALAEEAPQPGVSSSEMAHSTVGEELL